MIKGTEMRPSSAETLVEKHHKERAQQPKPGSGATEEALHRSVPESDSDPEETRSYLPWIRPSTPIR